MWRARNADLVKKELPRIISNAKISKQHQHYEFVFSLYIHTSIYKIWNSNKKKIPNETWFLPAVFHCFGQRRFRLQNNFVYLFVQLKSMWQKENINTKYNYNIYCLNIAIPGGRGQKRSEPPTNQSSWMELTKTNITSIVFRWAC